ncbi:Ocs element-binding factor 1 [Apostasia shenzhenica]|uniref:Ocs element-binding factor 1 n=1 Tax=Apostasia shenzhenica TaxID=1088818 RepID=A0A2I0B100_9ASPA|nr:Ocs element-binding factor 1 [Apostasia shenzhenica]
MASPGGTSSGSCSPMTNSGSDEDLQALMDQKKRKRMISNRESARKSRMRKQKHLDDLMTQVNQQRKENSEILTALHLTTHHYVGVESENSVLRTQFMELNSRLNSLNEILHYMNFNNQADLHSQMMIQSDSLINPWSLLLMNQPQTAYSDMLLQY